MGAAYSAFDETKKERVALKRLSADAPKVATSLFEREYYTLAGLRHRNIVEVYDYGCDRDGAYYTMELLEGTDLGKLAPLSWEEVCRCLRDTASILGVLHARRLLHRDLSPRNLFREADGRIKLIDFGALSPFGVPTEIVGTPPLIPPEALGKTGLDQRSDLYALGALGYWLLTGTHAYPAKSVKELPAFFERDISPPSVVARLSESPHPEIPEELDALILALIRKDPETRPPSTAALIDRLGLIAGLPPEAHAVAIDGYLQCKRFVGREPEVAQVRAALTQAKCGAGLSVMIESAPGLGRSRLCEEFEIEARLAGAITLRSDATVGADVPYGVARELALSLLDALPVEAGRAARSLAPVLGHLSPDLRGRLGNDVALSPIPPTPGEARMRIQGALHDWFLAVSRERLLAVVVDDLHAIDEESAALLATLAYSSNKSPLVVVVTMVEGSEVSGAASRLYRAATCLRLSPLSLEDTHALLGSVFGQTMFLDRLSDRLHRVSGGSPARCLGLAEHLVRAKTIRYADGMWLLPAKVLDEQLPKNSSDALTARLERLSPEARAVARVLAVHGSSIPLEICLVLSELGRAQTFAALAELSLAGIVVESTRGFRIAQDGLREVLVAELGPARRTRAHLLLGEHILAGAGESTLEQLRGGVHLLRGGQAARGSTLVTRAGLHYATVDPVSAASAIPLLEDAVELLRAGERSRYELVAPLVALTRAGYYFDRRLAIRFGDQAVDALERLLWLPLSRKLRPFLGPKLALFIALGVAALGFVFRSKSARVPSLVDAIQLLLTTTTIASGVAMLCLDRINVARYVAASEPLAALGPDHVAGFAHDFGLGLMKQNRDGPAASVAHSERLLARLESPVPIAELPEAARIDLLGGVLLCLGSSEIMRDGPRALEIAERLDRLGLKMYEMTADCLRMTYYARQGAFDLSEQYRRRLDLHAIKSGTTWQMDMWILINEPSTALHTRDALAAKRSAEALDLLCPEIPALDLTARRSWGVYFALRRKHAEAKKWLETGEAPLEVIAWACVRGTLARTHNELGEHARAKEICLHALGLRTPQDLSFTCYNLVPQIELAMAEGGLGNYAVAREQLDALLEKVLPLEGPVTLGALHDARARLAFAEGDEPAYREHLAQMERWYRPTGAPQLIDCIERVARLAAKRRALDRDLTTTIDAQTRTVAQLRSNALSAVDRLESMLSRESEPRGLAERARKALEVAAELSGAERGFIVINGESRSVVAIGKDTPTSELLGWVRERVMAASEDEETAPMSEIDLAPDPYTRLVGAMHFRASHLWASAGGNDSIVGTLALGSEDGVPRLPHPDVLLMMARYLSSARG
jgi:hypothetical protein